jgi:hypothetical protein
VVEGQFGKALDQVVGRAGEGVVRVAGVGDGGADVEDPADGRRVTAGSVGGVVDDAVALEQALRREFGSDRGDPAVPLAPDQLEHAGP